MILLAVEERGHGRKLLLVFLNCFWVEIYKALAIVLCFRTKQDLRGDSSSRVDVMCIFVGPVFAWFHF